MRLQFIFEAVSKLSVMPDGFKMTGSVETLCRAQSHLPIFSVDVPVQMSINLLAPEFSLKF